VKAWQGRSSSGQGDESSLFEMVAGGEGILYAQLFLQTESVPMVFVTRIP
jgi:hypothetical protein